MAEGPDDRAVRRRMQRIESLIQEIERYPDPAARARTKEIVHAVLDLHGDGMGRILEYLANSGEAGLAMIDELGRDELVSSLLLLYGLHPLDLETRVRQALGKARYWMRSRGAVVELSSVQDGIVRLHVRRIEDQDDFDVAKLKLAIEEAVYDMAPDVAAIEIQESVETAAGQNDKPRFALPLVHRA
jgi:hypothetical protein